MPESLRAHTNWRTLVSYWAWILTACVGIGSALRASGQYWASAGFFAVAGLSAVCKSIQVAVDAKEDKLSHRIAYATGYSFLATLVAGLVIWGVLHRPGPPVAPVNTNAATEEPPPPQEPLSTPQQSAQQQLTEGERHFLTYVDEVIKQGEELHGLFVKQETPSPALIYRTRQQWEVTCRGLLQHVSETAAIEFLDIRGPNEVTAEILGRQLDYLKQRRAALVNKQVAR